jgi:hypothetical protein
LSLGPPTASPTGRWSSVAPVPAPAPPGGAGTDCLAATSLRLLRAAAGAVGEVAPGAVRAAWRELENKVHAFEWFTFAAPRLGDPAAGPAELARRASRVDALADPYTGLWAMEGLGYAGAGAGQAASPRPEAMAAGGDPLAGLPGRAVVPWLSGSALAVAEHLLAALEREEGAERDLVPRWLRHCRDGPCGGHGELAVEALGLVVRTLAPWRLAALDEVLAGIGPVLADYLWHGVGRGLYFAPMHLLPWSGGWRRAYAKARSEPPRESARRNAIAGLAWALTLVNVRSPEVVAACVAGSGVEQDGEAAVANGASSALAVWRQWAGTDVLLERFLAYQPEGASRGRCWRLRVADPARAALASPSHDLRHRDRVAALFRFQAPP